MDCFKIKSVKIPTFEKIAKRFLLLQNENDSNFQYRMNWKQSIMCFKLRDLRFLFHLIAPK